MTVKRNGWRLVGVLGLCLALLLTASVRSAEAQTILKVVDLYPQIDVTRANSAYGIPANAPTWLYTSGNYDGTVTVHFEAVLAVSAGSGTAYAALYTAGGSVVTGSEVTHTTSTLTRVRSGDLLANLTTATDYQVRIKSTDGTVTAKLYAARLIIVQSGTLTKTETLFPFGSNTTTASTSYIEDSVKSYYPYDADQFDGTVALYFEAYLSNATAGQVTYAELHDGTSSVASSEVTATGTTETRARSSALTLTDGSTYRVRLKAGGGTARLRSAYLVIVQTGTPTKTETYIPIDHTTRNATTQVNMDSPIYWDADQWTGSTLTGPYLEATMAGASASVMTVDLNDGSSDAGSVSTSGTGKQVQRSTALTLSDNTTYDGQATRSSGTQTVTVYGTWLVVKATISANTAPTIALNTADATSFVTTTPTLEFTGSDVDSDDLRYQLQITDNPDGFTGGEILVDSYTVATNGLSVHPQSNASGNAWDGYRQMDDRPGQSWTGKGGRLTRFSLSLVKDGSNSPSGGSVLRTYAHAGIWGTSSAPLSAADRANTPTPNWLGESDNLAFTSGMSATEAWYDWTFSGASQARTANGTHYVTLLNYRPDSDDTLNTFSVHGNAVDDTLHPGNAYNDGAAAGAVNHGPQAWDFRFRAYETFVLLDKLSGTDAGFTNTVTGGDTDPFNADEKVSSTVQGGDALSAGATYYWRVRVIDPAGSATYSSWSSTRSFSIAVGAIPIVIHHIKQQGDE